MPRPLASTQSLPALTARQSHVVSGPQSSTAGKGGGGDGVLWAVGALSAPSKKHPHSDKPTWGKITSLF